MNFRLDAREPEDVTRLVPNGSMLATRREPPRCTSRTPSWRIRLANRPQAAGPFGRSTRIWSMRACRSA
jgi:hypothetical protein